MGRMTADGEFAFTVKNPLKDSQTSWSTWFKSHRLSDSSLGNYLQIKFPDSVDDGAGGDVFIKIVSHEQRNRVCQILDALTSVYGDNSSFSASFFTPNQLRATVNISGFLVVLNDELPDNMSSLFSGGTLPTYLNFMWYFLSNRTNI